MILESLTPTESNPLGLVEVVRVLRSGDTISEWMTILCAVDEVFFGIFNGDEVVSAHICYGEASGGTIALSGSALCAEYSHIAHYWQ